MSFLVNHWVLSGGMVVVFGLGYWLNILDKPYPMLLLTIHKLLPLPIIYVVIREILKQGSLPEMAKTDLALFLLGILLLGLTIATGAMLSTEKEWPALIGWAHHVLPYLTVAGWGLLFTRVLF